MSTTALIFLALFIAAILAAGTCVFIRFTALFRRHERQLQRLFKQNKLLNKKLMNVNSRVFALEQPSTYAEFLEDVGIDEVPAFLRPQAD